MTNFKTKSEMFDECRMRIQSSVGAIQEMESKIEDIKWEIEREEAKQKELVETASMYATNRFIEEIAKLDIALTEALMMPTYEIISLLRKKENKEKQ